MHLNGLAHIHRFRTVSLLSLIVIASLCCAQDARQEPTWPSRSLRLIAVGAPGGSVDIPARVIAERLNQEVQRILALPDVRELFERNLIQPAGGSSATFGRLIQSEFRKWGPVIRYTGAKPD